MAVYDEGSQQMGASMMMAERQKEAHIRTVQLNSGSIADKITSAKDHYEEIPVGAVFAQNEMIDSKGVTSRGQTKKLPIKTNKKINMRGQQVHHPHVEAVDSAAEEAGRATDHGEECYQNTIKQESQELPNTHSDGHPHPADQGTKQGHVRQGVPADGGRYDGDRAVQGSH
jgi:hypothetical protein